MCRVPRSGPAGFSSSEGWAAASGVFAVRGWTAVFGDVFVDDFGFVARPEGAMLVAAPAWAAFKSGSDAALYSAVNRELIAGGYTRPDGSTVT